MAGQYVLPKGWMRKHPLDLVKAFTQKNGHAPNEQQLKCLKHCVDKAKQGIRVGRQGEWYFEHGWYAGLMTVRKGDCLTPKEWDNGEAKDPHKFKGKPKSAGGKARVVVGARVDKWKREHPGFLSDIGNFFSNAAKVAGGALHSALHAVSKVTGEIASLAGKIPFIGPALHATFDAAFGAPFALADSVASGRRVDKALLDNLKRNVADAKEVAPYVQTVISFVPGVGQGVSGVIGASLVLAEGHPITEALEKGLIAAVPGGPAGEAVTKMSVGIMKGERIDHIALDVVPIPEEQKKLVTSALQIVSDVANKRNVSKDLLSGVLKNIPGGPQPVIDFAKKNDIPVEVAAAEAAIKTLPPQLKKAVNIGAAIGHAQQLQKLAKQGIESAIPNLQVIGAEQVKQFPELQELAKQLKDTSGLKIGAALVHHKGVSPSDVEFLRKKMKVGDQRKGFDMALAMHIGKVTSPERKGTPAQLAGYYTIKGIHGGTEAQKVGISETIKKNPDMVKGAVVATSENLWWWPKVLRYFGFHTK